jgi:hypothetical protein
MGFVPGLLQIAMQKSLIDAIEIGLRIVVSA